MDDSQAVRVWVAQRANVTFLVRSECIPMAQCSRDAACATYGMSKGDLDLPNWFPRLGIAKHNERLPTRFYSSEDGTPWYIARFI